MRRGRRLGSRDGSVGFFRPSSLLSDSRRINVVSIAVRPLSATPLDAVHLINHMPELLALERRIDVQTSFSDREMVWSSRVADRGLATVPDLISR